MPYIIHNVIVQSLIKVHKFTLIDISSKLSSKLKSNHDNNLTTNLTSLIDGSSKTLENPIDENWQQCECYDRTVVGLYHLTEDRRIVQTCGGDLNCSRSRLPGGQFWQHILYTQAFVLQASGPFLPFSRTGINWFLQHHYASIQPFICRFRIRTVPVMC